MRRCFSWLKGTHPQQDDTTTRSHNLLVLEAVMHLAWIGKGRLNGFRVFLDVFVLIVTVSSPGGCSRCSFCLSKVALLSSGLCKKLIRVILLLLVAYVHGLMLVSVCLSSKSMHLV